MNISVPCSEDREDHLDDTPEEVYQGYENALDGTITPDQFLMTDEEKAALEASESKVEEVEETLEVDPEAYNAMKQAADEQYREREEARKRTLMQDARQEVQEEALKDETASQPDEPEEKDELDEFLKDDDEDALRKRNSVLNNKAENIDTAAEVALEARSLNPGAAQLVDDGVIRQTQEMIDERNANRQVDADFLRQVVFYCKV